MKNQCDGCQAGIPAINGVHRMGKPGGYSDGMSCQAHKYQETKEDTEDAWRQLALQFDRHRMQALALLKMAASDDAGPETVEAIKAFLAAPPPIKHIPELEVWCGPMPESNGKQNYTAILKHKGVSMLDSPLHTIYRSEYPGRARYEADRVAYLIGEITQKPSILDYDTDAHSGYKAPENA